MENNPANFTQKATPWAIICPVHGQVFLNEREYLTQLGNPDSFWKCPICGYYDPFLWDDDNWEEYFLQGQEYNEKGEY